MTDFTPSVTEQTVPAQTNGASVKRADLTQIPGLPVAQGLYDPRNEHDACGVGFIAQMKGVKSHQIVEDGLAMLENLTHRGAVGADPLMGDGAGVLVQIPDRFFREEMAKQGIELPPAGHYGVGHWFMPQDAAMREHINEVIAEVGAVRRPAADRLPRRAGRQFLAVQGAGHRRRRAVPPPGLHRPSSRDRRRRGIRSAGSICCAR